MLSIILGKLFKHDYSYIPHPNDHWASSVLLMAMGMVTWLYNGWFPFGIASFILGVLTGLWIIGAGWLDALTRYWDALANASKSPDIREALGLSVSRETVRVIEDLNEEHGVFSTTRFHELPISPQIMQAIADTVLSGNSFSENEIVKNRKIVSSPKFRKLHKELESKNMLRPHNTKHRNQGFAFTHKGMQLLYECASESVKGLRDNA